jgi:hypothetical protein
MHSLVRLTFRYAYTHLILRTYTSILVATFKPTPAFVGASSLTLSNLLRNR